jgi:hypothetical protein
MPKCAAPSSLCDAGCVVEGCRALSLLHSLDACCDVACVTWVCDLAQRVRCTVCGKLCNTQCKTRKWRGTVVHQHCCLHHRHDTTHTLLCAVSLAPALRCSTMWWSISMGMTSQRRSARRNRKTHCHVSSLPFAYSGSAPDQPPPHHPPARPQTNPLRCLPPLSTIASFLRTPHRSVACLLSACCSSQRSIVLRRQRSRFGNATYCISGSHFVLSE